MAWIKLDTEPGDAKVLRLAQLTKTDSDRVFVAIVRWFFWLDSNYKGCPLTVTETAFHDLTRWTSRESLAAALCHEEINWLERKPDGSLCPTRPDSHFSQSAKQRALTAKRVREHRQRAPQVDRNGKCSVTPLQNRYLEESKKREEQIRVSECACDPPDSGYTTVTVSDLATAAGLRDPDEIVLLEAVAKRQLRADERMTVCREAARQEQCLPVHIHGSPVAAGDLWRRCLAQLGREPGFVFQTATAALRYAGAILARCQDQGVFPDEKPPDRPRASGDAGATDEEIKAAIADGIARAERKMRRRA